jgi:4-aminobutyrate aminotransferase-like enzyme
MEKTLQQLERYESRNITFMEADGSWPIVWERASGMHVWDTHGKKYLDLTAAFGVAAAGHANARVVRAGQRQMVRLLHAMGDVHPHPLKGELVQRLSELTFERWSNGKIRGKTILGNSGFEAVEAALKTAMLATGRPGVIAFEGAYHGLGYGALNATHRPHFHAPFQKQLRRFGTAAAWPEEDLFNVESEIRKLARTRKFGAILVEPIQARGGIRIPPDGFLKSLRALADEFGMLLILDDIYTGFGRTGQWFACEHEGVVPDLICLGKALTGGFPMSACVGRAEIMDHAWPRSEGEAIHTSTFLGHPVGCAMALAQMKEIPKLLGRTQRSGKLLLSELQKVTSTGKRKLLVRGRGLIAAVELRDERNRPDTTGSLAVIKNLLHRRFIFLPEGEHGNVIGFTPPLIITDAQIRQSVGALSDELSRLP